MAKEPAPKKKKAPARKAPPRKKAPARKAPPRKKAPRKKKKARPAAIHTATALRLPAGRTTHIVRHEAGIQYRFDPEKRPVEWWWENHYTNDISLARFRKWASVDKWVDQRNHHWDQVLAAVARDLAGEATKAAINEAKQIATVRKWAYNLLEGVDAKGNKVGLLEAKSYEGAVGAFVKLDERLDKKRDTLLAQLPVGATDNSPKTGTGVDFTEEEYQDMARALLRRRHALPESEE